MAVLRRRAVATVALAALGAAVSFFVRADAYVKETFGGIRT